MKLHHHVICITSHLHVIVMDAEGERNNIEETECNNTLWMCLDLQISFRFLNVKISILFHYLGLGLAKVTPKETGTRTNSHNFIHSLAGAVTYIANKWDAVQLLWKKITNLIHEEYWWQNNFTPWQHCTMMEALHLSLGQPDSSQCMAPVKWLLTSSSISVVDISLGSESQTSVKTPHYFKVRMFIQWSIFKQSDKGKAGGGWMNKVSECPCCWKAESATDKYMLLRQSLNSKMSLFTFIFKCH